MNKKRLLLFVAVTGCVLAAIMHFAIRPVAYAQSAPREIEIKCRRFEFVPDRITLKQGEPVTLKLSTEDVAHGLYVRDLKINEVVEPGEVREISLVPESEGTYRGSCQKFCGEEHAKMKLTIVVE
jgi:cytochrome c oxidase subunit 2